MTHAVRGQFSWHELLTSDAEDAAEFYRALFAWDVHAWDAGLVPCTLLGRAGAPFGAISALPEEADTAALSPAWFGYVHVPDLDATAELAQHLGGSLLAGPFETPGIGRIASLRDPEGALFSVITEAGTERPHVPPRGPGRFCWHELHARDPASMASFYAALFDWRAESVSMDGRDYRVLHCGDTPEAGITWVDGEREPRWRVYVEVADLDTAVQGALALGGQLLQPVTELVTGRYAQLRDPQGARFALFEARPRRSDA